MSVSPRDFISLHQMNQIWEHNCEKDRENSPEVTSSPILAQALLYIHQSAVSYSGQLHSQVFRRPHGRRPFWLPLLYASSFSQTWLVPMNLCPKVNIWSYITREITKAENITLNTDLCQLHQVCPGNSYEQPQLNN